MASPVVNISEGALRGYIGQDLDGREFLSFLGIPYAKPPVGKLRFKAPQPIEPWDGVKDATRVGSPCIQSDLLANVEKLGSEDCLNLNVFTRNLPQDGIELKPVMVWIHGGAFTSGSNDIKMYGAEYLITEDIVLVSINYRVGFLGFLRLEDPSLEVPGNAGLKDQVLALKWVQRNIKQFNGDPNNVTIFGESAGGASVHYHILSPSSKGLFHKAIAQSGAVLNPWAFTDPNTSAFLNFVAKGAKDETTALEVLRKLPIEELFDHQVKFLKDGPSLGVIGPVIEKPNPTAFLTRDPREVIMSGEYNHVPIIFGYTSNEGMLFVAFQRLAKEGKALPLEVTPGLENFIPPEMKVEKGSSTSQQICKLLADCYYQGENAKNETLLISDTFVVNGITVSAIHHSKTCHHPVFLYRMSCETNLNIIKRLGQVDDCPGVCHGDDIGYLFKSSVGPETNIGEIENKCLRQVLKLWTNFARYGNPTPEDGKLGVQWKPMEREKMNLLDIGRELTMQAVQKDDRFKLWRDIYHLSPVTANYL